MTFRHSLPTFLTLACLWGLLLGCGGTNPPAENARDAGPNGGAQTSTAIGTGESDDADIDSPRPKKKTRKKAQSLQLGGGAGNTDSTTSEPKISAEGVLARLQPFQVLLGQWRWVTQKKFGAFPRTGEDLRWIWDFRTDPGRPALLARSDENPYLREMRLTAAGEDEIEAMLTPPEGTARKLRGRWLEGNEPKETPDGKILQRTFKLQLAQQEPTEGEQWQLTLNLLDNDQFLFELKRRAAAGATLQQLDTVRQQRQGTSFAVAESDNPGPKCIVSGGLGTMSVSYQGKTYPVCCSGCSAAFNDDPERWLAKLKAKEPAQKDQNDNR